jgi:hypothetical protein
MRHSRLVVLLVPLVIATGCLRSSYYKKVTLFPKSSTGSAKDAPSDAAPATVVTMDVRQRIVVGSVVDQKLRICTEPSPDALSAAASSAGVSLSKADALQLAANLSAAEGAAFIGLRTQSIQLMRDAMFRICEAYVSGAINGRGYETLLRRYQSSMVGILAIEQLTGVVRAAPVSLGGAAEQGDVDRLAQLTKETDDAKESLSNAENDVTAKQDVATKAADKKKDIDDKIAALNAKAARNADEQKALDDLISQRDDAVAADKDATKALVDAKATRDKQDESYKKLDAERRAALAGGGSATMTAGASSDQTVAPVDRTAVASAVRDIVDETLNLEFGRELCTTVLTANYEPGATEPFSSCLKYLQETQEYLDADKQVKASRNTKIDDALAAATEQLRASHGDVDKVKSITELLQVLLSAGNAEAAMAAPNGGRLMQRH